ncbi:TetR/AcrR family transcriptional regulator [Sinomonas sp. ASV486]|uniref:TetR/AcrR family transcriptional regulator n=1 Tax=Sinomonas sp. ASV486 TaxID=3051170 RepID=UPI0027DC0DC0|nr:TetR/AcrR family transcriptional regulator [Sinomonas sp. ASV486]MDQ4490841.1 TetR/AcrR family transcriptional regulator [Sinomonas sp. ASV486]
MPTPERTNLTQIVEAAKTILEESGLAGLTMSAVAARVGVRAPSLYKRVGGRDELLGLVADATVLDLAGRIDAAMHGGAETGQGAAPTGGSGRETPSGAANGAVLPGGAAHDGGAEPRAALSRMVRAYRDFAKERPAAYQLVFTQAPREARPRPESLAKAVAPALAAAERLVGPEHALDAARLLTAWTHGFVTMELSGSFRLAGGVDAAFEYGLSALAETLGRD